MVLNITLPMAKECVLIQITVPVDGCLIAVKCSSEWLGWRRYPPAPHCGRNLSHCAYAR